MRAVSSFVKIVFISFSVLLTSGCGHSGVSPENAAALDGVWSETFVWNGWHGITPSGTDGPLSATAPLLRTSTLTIANNRFRLQISPAIRAVAAAGDSIYMTHLDDTLKTGTISVSDDTLRFLIDGEDTTEDYTFSVGADSVSVAASEREDSAGSFIRLTSILWANSLNKTSGKFHRVR